MAKDFHFRVVTPDRVVLDRKVTAVQFMGVDGSYGILANHAPLMTATRPGIVTFENTDGSREEMLATDGFAEMRDNVLSLITEAGERADEIDLERAQEAERRARERLQSLEGSDVAISGALNRAMLRQLLVARRRTGTGTMR